MAFASTSVYRCTVKMSEGGRSNRDTHSIVFLMSAVGGGALDGLEFNTFAHSLASTLNTVCFNRTNFLRMSAVRLNTSGRAIKESALTVGLEEKGVVAFDDGDGPSRDEVALSLEKSAIGARPAKMYLRHCLSALEEAAYLNDGTIPTRFTDVYGAPLAPKTLGTAIIEAFTAASYDMVLPGGAANGLTAPKIVTHLSAQQFVLIKATRRRRSAEKDAVSGAQKEINSLVKKIRQVWDNPGIMTVIEATAAVAAWAVQIYGVYSGLTFAEKIAIEIGADILALPPFTPGA